MSDVSYLCGGTIQDSFGTYKDKKEVFWICVHIFLCFRIMFFFSLEKAFCVAYRFLRNCDSNFCLGILTFLWREKINKKYHFSQKHYLQPLLGMRNITNNKNSAKELTCSADNCYQFWFPALDYPPIMRKKCS